MTSMSSGPTCEKKLDSCDSNLCSGNSTCVGRSDGSYTCSCSPATTGQYCDVTIVNGTWGNWGGWTTICANGHQFRERYCDNPAPINGGAFCEGSDQETRECNSTSSCDTSCENGGQCLKTGSDFTCSCLPGFTGPTCSKHDCVINRCSNGSTCVGYDNATYSCSCPPGKTGEYCNINIRNGGWTQWTAWREDCSNGVEIRERECANPTPEHGGKPCQGLATETRPCPPPLACESDPCANGGLCNDIQQGFNCTCLPGFKGPTCKDSDCSYRSLCFIGSACVAQDNGTYSCVCPPGMTGQYCNFRIVDGGWSMWSEWQGTCPGGGLKRTRTCTYPAPMHGGKLCSGHKEELNACPECTALKAPVNGSLDCSKSNATHNVCQITCNSGYAIVDELPDPLTCGAHTYFLWAHETFARKTPILPPCAKQAAPTLLSITLSAEIPGPDCNNTKHRTDLVSIMTQQVTSLLVSSDCYAEKRCTFKKVTACTKRPADTANIQVHLSVQASSSKDRTKEKFVDAVKSIQKAFQALIQQYQDKKQGFAIDGKVYYPLAESISGTTVTTCPPKYVPSDLDSFTCEVCPSGKRYVQSPEGGVCEACPKGTYQPQDGQTTCPPCPTGTTTLDVAASDISTCVTITTTTATPILTTTTKVCLGEDKLPQCPRYAGDCGSPDVAKHCEKTCCETLRS